MKRLILILFTLSISMEVKAAPRVSTLRYPIDFIVSEVFKLRNITQNSARPLPQIIFESQTTLKSFQKDLVKQWKTVPSAIINVYFVAGNKIYIMDKSGHYEKFGRCMDDSLAHELTHYIQVYYQNYSLDDLDNEATEQEAIEVQNRFREKFCPKG